MKLITPAERTVAEKDFREVWGSKMARSTIIVMPLVMVVLLPVVYLVIIYTVPASEMNGVDQMMKLLPPEAAGFDLRQSMFYMMVNVICPMFFLMVPLMCSSVSAACSFVGERERGTLETLLLTPLSLKQIFKAKVLGCVFLSAVTTAISFAAFTVVISVGDILLGMPFFLNWNWLVLILLLSPGVTVFGVIFMVLISGRSKSYTESVQTSGYLVLPLVLLFLGQFTGLFQLNALILLLVSLCVVAADVPLWMVAARSFRPEKLLR